MFISYVHYKNSFVFLFPTGSSIKVCSSVVKLVDFNYMYIHDMCKGPSNDNVQLAIKHCIDL